MKPLRIVIDTSVLVAGLKSRRGASYALLLIAAVTPNQFLKQYSMKKLTSKEAARLARKL